MRPANIDMPPMLLPDRAETRRQEQNGVAFEVPRDWVDRTVVAFAAPAKPGVANAPNIVVTEEPLGGGETLQSHADGQLAGLAKQLPDFELLERSDVEIDGLPGLFVRFSWTSHFGPLEQSMTWVARGTERMLLTFTTTGLLEEVEQVRPAFAEILRSVRLAGSQRTSDVVPRPSEDEADALALVPMPGQRSRRRP